MFGGYWLGLKIIVKERNVFYFCAVKSELSGSCLWRRTPWACGRSPGPSAELHQLQGLAGSQKTLFSGTTMTRQVPRSLLHFYTGETTRDSWVFC